MWPNQVSNPGTLAHESDMLLTALRSPANYSTKNAMNTTISAPDKKG